MSPGARVCPAVGPRSPTRGALRRGQREDCRADELGRDRIRAEGRSAEKPGVFLPESPLLDVRRAFVVSSECSRMRLRWFSQDHKAPGVVGTSVFVFGAEVLELY